MVSPWAAPHRGHTGEPLAAPVPPTNNGAPQQPRSRRRWVGVAGGVAVTAAAMAGGAGVTYGVMSHKSALPQAENQPSPPATAPTYSDAERDAAKQHLCGAFDASTRGHKDRGAVVVDGEPNVLVILRKVGSVKAVENALAPATPPEVAVAAHKYIDTALDVTTAAMEGASGEDLTRLVVVGNEAIRAFVGVCGLRH